ncbi:MMPL family transporter [Haloglycomyces albus]|uniref:MMPL family transporter n=1 Tax=Haloglycomyces albus TaxID=526067 RepID=UPI000686F510|nr:MMPL family transporter [Haloglycomyces albus]
MMTGAISSRSSSPLVRVSAWTRRCPWWALVAWLAILGGLLAAATSVGSAFEDDHSLPGSQSQELSDRLEEIDTGFDSDEVRIVFEAAGGIDSQESAIASLLREVESLPGVAGVDSPFEVPGAVSEDGTIAYATAQWDGSNAQALDLLDQVEGASDDDVTAVAGGDVISEVQEDEAGGSAEGVGMTAALVILVVMFGSFVAAGMPLITAVFAVGSAYGVMALVSNVIVLPTYLPPNMFLVGLGVGIDYALLIFARYRSEIQNGLDRAEATDKAIDTAGRSVLFAGSVVMVALLGLWATGLAALQGVALGVSVTVLLTMIASVTLLPSLLTLFGKRLEKNAHRRAAKGRRQENSRWWGWSRFIERHAVAASVGVGVVLLVLASPIMNLRLGFADAGSDADGLPTREAYDLMAEGFGPGANGPLMISTEGSREDAEATVGAMEELSAVESVSPAVELDDGFWLSTAIPVEGPNADETIDLVHQLRDDALAEAPGDHLVGGMTTAAIDYNEAIRDSAAVFLLFVVGLTFVILLLVFRSVLIPLKAALLNVVMIAASLGVVSVIFQRGWFGIEPGPVESFVPIMLFAIVFGLSMDYEVFLVSRMREEWVRSRDASYAVRKGLVSTGSVVTAAATIMIAVFASFVLSDVRMMQQFGIGMAVAIFLDAFVIRSFAMPAIMRLFGARAWWIPRWLDRFLPRVTVEEEQAETQRKPRVPASLS